MPNIDLNGSHKSFTHVATPQYGYLYYISFIFTATLDPRQGTEQSGVKECIRNHYFTKIQRVSA